jgi:membrane-associated phospholipid phosphatase
MRLLRLPTVLPDLRRRPRSRAEARRGGGLGGPGGAAGIFYARDLVQDPLPSAWRDQVAAFDQRADRALDRLRGHPLADRVFYTASELGDFGLVWQALAVARGLSSPKPGRDVARLSALLGAESALVNGVIKSFFRRTRPEWEQPRAYRIRKPLSSSFPSGHASSAFTAAALLSEGSPWWPAYYGIAVVVATSRAYVRIHHASDVVAGVATGVVLGRVARRAWPVDRSARPGVAGAASAPAAPREGAE